MERAKWEMCADVGWDYKMQSSIWGQETEVAGGKIDFFGRNFSEIMIITNMGDARKCEMSIDDSFFRLPSPSNSIARVTSERALGHARYSCSGKINIG